LSSCAYLAFLQAGAGSGSLSHSSSLQHGPCTGHRDSECALRTLRSVRRSTSFLYTGCSPERLDRHPVCTNIERPILREFAQNLRRIAQLRTGARLNIDSMAKCICVLQRSGNGFCLAVIDR
jgi:hypothetical protein